MRLDRSLLVIANALFVLLYLTLCYFNRIAIDDFYFLSLAKQFGPIEAMIVERSTWSARWASVLLNQVVLSFHGSRYNLFFFGMIAGLLFIHAVERILRRIAVEDLQTDRWLRWNLSLFIVSAIFNSTFSIGQTWFWLCSACTYLIGMIMLLLGISSLIKHRSKWTDPFLIAISFLYVGGSSEPLALFVLFILVVLIPWRKLRGGIPVRSLWIAMLSCLIGFAILYSGDGNFKRAGHFQEIGVISAALLNVKTTGIILLKDLPWIIPPLVLYGIPIAGLLQGSNIAIKRTSVVQRIMIIGGCFLLSILLFQLPITFATQDVGADRTLFPITFLALIASAAIFLQLLPLVDRWRRMLIRIALSGVIILNGLTLFDQLNVLPVYAAAYDERMRLLEGSKGITGTIVLDPLPPSGLLLTAEISTDPQHFSNQHLRSGLGLKAQVKKAE